MRGMYWRNEGALIRGGSPTPQPPAGPHQPGPHDLSAGWVGGAGGGGGLRV